MIFNSLHYAIFLPIVFILYWLIPHRFRWFLLLIASYYFYMSWNVKYVALILFTTMVSYSAALCLEKTRDAAKKKLIVMIALVLCLGVLFVFKYFNFFFETINNLFSAFSISLHVTTLQLLLPVGISFYTFQTLSYVIDVYRGDISAEKHFGIYATFVSFFPQLVAGPIERSSNLLPQIKEEHFFNYDQATYGLKMIAWGLFKKIVVADNLAIYVDLIYDNLPQYSGFALVLATFFFTVQIYCDFSGYSDIAKGSAKLMGIELMDNFNSPYFSESIKTFWSRWHISLSTWFKDYLYIPLGGNRTGSKIKNNLNLLITFLISGLWHGANLTFIYWGGVHGLAQIGENTLGLGHSENTHGIKWCLRCLLVFIFVMFAWVFFRAQTVNDAVYVFRHLFIGKNSLNNIIHLKNYIVQGLNDLNIGKIQTLKIIAYYFLPIAAFDYFSMKTDVILWVSRRKTIIRWAIYLILMIAIWFLKPVTNDSQFIYFQF